MPNVAWKPIEGYEGSYEVSSDGRVRGLDRIVHRSTSPRFVRGMEIKPHRSNSGYDFVLLRKDGKQKPFYIHRLVATAFVEKPDGCNVVNHIDEDKLNNQAKNLEWCTHGENMKYAGGGHRRVMDRMKPVRISRDGQVVKICESVVAAADYIGCSASQISKCCKRKKNQIHVYGYEVSYAVQTTGGGDA